MPDFFSDSDFITRSHCGLWTPVLITYYIAANTVIAFAYFTIPIYIIIYARSRRLHATFPKSVLALFAAFIFSCGLGHIFDGIMPFVYPNYRFIAFHHSITAILSLSTVLLIPRIAVSRLLEHDDPRRRHPTSSSN